jgi:hypothetical protein
MLDVGTYEDRIVVMGKNNQVIRASKTQNHDLDTANDDEAAKINTDDVINIINKLTEMNKVDVDAVENKLKNIWPSITRRMGNGKKSVDLPEIKYKPSDTSYERSMKIVVSQTGIGYKGSYDNVGKFGVSLKVLGHIIKSKDEIRKHIKISYLSVFDDLMAELEKLDLKEDYKDTEQIEIPIRRENIKGKILNANYDESDTSEDKMSPVLDVVFQTIKLSPKGIQITWPKIKTSSWGSDTSERWVLEIEERYNNNTREITSTVHPLFVYVMPLMPKLKKAVDKMHDEVVKDRQALVELNKVLEKFNSVNEVVKNL